MKLLEVNVGRLDRLVRIAIGGSVVMYAAGLVPTPLNFLAILLGLIVLGTGLMGTCGLYSLLGVNSIGVTKAPAAKKSRRK